MDVLLTVLAFAAFGVTSLFLLAFCREPWWRHPFGQSVMSMALAVWILSGLGALRTFFGDDYLLRPYLLGLGRLLVTVAMGQRLYVLLRARAEDRGR